jgi:predicted ATP-dependent protease
VLLFPAANLKDVDDIPLDVREKLELIAVETMDEVFACALSRVILPQAMNGAFTLEDVAAAEAGEELGEGPVDEDEGED